MLYSKALPYGKKTLENRCKVYHLLKYGFCNKSFWKDEPLINLTLFNILIIKIRFSLSNVLIRGESNFYDKYVEKGVQLVRGSSFRNDLLQNPYFNELRVFLFIHK